MSVGNISEDVWCMERNRVVDLMASLNIEHDDCDGGAHCICDEEVLRSMLFSFCSSISDVDRLLEISEHFEESFELVQALLDSSSGTLTNDLVTQLLEDKNMRAEKVSHTSDGHINSFPDKVDSRSIIVVCEEILQHPIEPEEKLVLAEIRLSQPSVHAQVRVSRQSIRPRLPFGVSDLRISFKGTQNSKIMHHDQKVLVTSPVFRFAAALDAMYDRLYWGWEGHWSDALEASLFELLVAVDDDLVAMVKSWVAMLSVTGGADDMHHMLQCVTLDVQCALNSHSAQAIGRLHQTLVQFTDTGSVSMSMMQVPEVFVRATNAFIQAKMDASEMGAMKRDLEKLMFAATEYLDELTSPSTSHTLVTVSHIKETLGNMLHCARACIDSYHAAIAADTVNTTPTTLITLELAQLIHSLKPQGLDLITKSSITSWEFSKIDTMPFVPLDYITNPALLFQCMTRLSETLVMDAFNLGSVMGYTINESNVAQSAALISCMLEVGIAYVTSEAGKLMGLLPMERSMLVLNDPANTSSDNSSGGDASAACIPFVIPAQLRKRSKDMHRVFRNNVKATLSLRLNSNIDLAIQKLRLHHGSDCWVGPALRSVWKCMASTTPPQLLIFELWYGEEMIAADYAHPVCGGRSVYVATRFYNRSAEYRNLVPGFMLALVVTKYLQQLGCCVWDLGTSNLCPLMRYKLDLTGTPYSRPVAQYELLRAHNISHGNSSGNVGVSSEGMSALAAGVLISNITVGHLLT